MGTKAQINTVPGASNAHAAASALAPAGGPCHHSHGNPFGMSSGRPCRRPTRNSRASTRRGPGRLNMWLPSTSTTRPCLTAGSSALQGEVAGGKGEGACESGAVGMDGGVQEGSRMWAAPGGRTYTHAACQHANHPSQHRLTPTTISAHHRTGQLPSSLQVSSSPRPHTSPSPLPTQPLPPLPPQQQQRQHSPQRVLGQRVVQLLASELQPQATQRHNHPIRLAVQHLLSAGHV